MTQHEIKNMGICPHCYRSLEYQYGGRRQCPSWECRAQEVRDEQERNKRRVEDAMKEPTHDPR
jgi:hypothetical protein